MSYAVKWMNLKDLMKKIGPVSHVEVFTGNDGRSRGCGVVEFENADDAKEAIKEYEGYQHEGRKIHVREDAMADSTYEEQLKNQKEKTKLMKEREMNERFQQNSASSGLGGLGGLGALTGIGGLGGLGMMGNQAGGLIQMLSMKGGDSINATVFISNLDYQITWQDLKDSLRRAGNCKTCTISQDDKTRRSKGYGQAVFETPMEALTCIALFNGYEMGRDRRAMVVRLDRQAPLNQLLQQMGVVEITQSTLVQIQTMALLSQLGGLNNLQGLNALAGVSAGGLNNAALGGGNSNLGAYQNQSNLGSSGVGGGNALSGLSGVGLGNLGNLGGLGNLLGNQGAGTTSGMAGLSALQNTSASGFQFGGSNFGGTQQNTSGMGTNYTPGQQVGNYSITGQRSSSAGFATQDSRRRSSDLPGRYSDASSGSIAKTRVFVRNLPFSIKWQDLKDKFRDAGRISRADVKLDDNNRSKGCGTVTFETHEEALRAISIFNGSRLEGREIEVRLDRLPGDR